jgi:beta-N-acetylhexosaminidase
MNRQPKVGEVLILGFRGPEVPAWLTKFEKDFGLGGVILFDYDFKKKTYENNIFSRDQVTKLCQQIHAMPSYPLCFVDQEGGKVTRLKETKGFAPLPSAQQIAKLPVPERETLLQRSFHELREIGFDFNLAPVVDLDTNPNNPDIGAIGRSYSRSADVVRENVQIVVRAAADTGVSLCLKHYPGLGGAKTNSHEKLTDLTDTISKEQLSLFYELAPQIPGQAVLISHGLVHAWDERLPVSMSATALQPLRRASPELLLISDDLQMQGLQLVLDTSKAVIQGIAAGIDMLMIGNNLKDEQALMPEVAGRLREAVLSDPALLAKFQGSAARVARRKREFKGL